MLRSRAHRLLRWYPKQWRTRYGDEFVELLVADMEERPRSIQRTLDVARNGVVARSAAVGLGGQSLDRRGSDLRSLVAVGTALSIFMVFALAMWSQLTIGWQWSPPNTESTSWAMVVMSAAIVALVVLCLASVVPIVWSVGRSLGRDRLGTILPPLLLTIGGIGILVVGTRHFANGWPGTGGHPWVRQGMVPGGMAAAAWAATLFVTSYWAHPAALGGFPASEVTWMLLSPVALASVLVGVAKLVHRLDLTPRVLRYERQLTSATTLAMAAFFTGACMWVIDGGPGPRNLFHVGAIDIIDLAGIASAVALTGLAARRMGSDTSRLSPN